MNENFEQRTKYRELVLEKFTGLSTAAFGLVAALAWNDAIQSLFKIVFGEQSSLIAKFVYAAIITVVVVVVTVFLSRAQHRAKAIVEQVEDRKS